MLQHRSFTLSLMSPPKLSIHQNGSFSCSCGTLLQQNDHPVSISLTFSGLIGLPTVKKSLIPYRMGELSYVYFYPFLGIGDYQQKTPPTGIFFVLSYSLKLKAPSSIYLLGLAKNPRDCTTTVSLDTHHPTKNSLAAFPHWVTFVQSTLQCVFLGSHQFQKFLPPPIVTYLRH